MPRLPTILIVDDDEGHTILIRQSLAEIELPNPFVEFRDGQAVLDFLGRLTQDGAATHHKSPYLLLLDIRMPKVSGVEVLRRIKADPKLRLLPVIMLSTSDDPLEIERCHHLGCSAYVRKPADYDAFSTVVRSLGDFMRIVTVPQIVTG
jgi:CheY-like chemotaxis protein